MSVPRARLDKTGRRVLCESVVCGAAIAEVKMGHAVDHHGRGLGRLCLPGGWIQRRKHDVWVWVLTPRAKARVREGRQPSYRRTPDVDRAGAQVRVLEGGRWVRIDDGRPGRWGRFVNELPAQIECPGCGREQTMDPEMLRVESLDGRCSWPVVPPDTPLVPIWKRDPALDA